MEAWDDELVELLKFYLFVLFCFDLVLFFFLKEKFFVVESGEAREKLKTDRGGRGGAGSTTPQANFSRS